MFTSSHRLNDGTEDLDFPLLCTQEGVSFEEWKHASEQVLPQAHDQHIRVIVRPSVILAEPSTAQCGLNELQELDPYHVLADTELRD